MRFRSKKGFTMVELVVVVAIIAVLLAMILPNLSSRESNKIRVANGAKDFYVAIQHVFTKYAKQEINITGQDISSTDGSYLSVYDKEFGGNRPIRKYVFIYAEYSNGKIVTFDGYSADEPAVAMAYVLSHKYRTSDIVAGPNQTKFLQKILPELQTVFQASDGSYYALLEYDKSLQTLVTDNAGSNLIKVVFAGYGDYPLPRYTAEDMDTGAGGFEDYKQANLLVTDLGMISTGDYFGIQSSRKMTGSSDYIGDYGTYFAL
ncbi:MAG: prepilin-type N-terminal cleavage/methylation domain-containing protein [Oscillospiraceae bacterium]|nr:prepilin-type N-terminal cleavage/methylation domain-containing protein [Oscillospiraceae bacterium]